MAFPLDTIIDILRSLFGTKTVSGSGILLSGLAPTVYDEITLAYTGSNLTTVTYKLASVTQITLTLTYSGSDLIDVVRS